jgi:hypothetical protein
MGEAAERGEIALGACVIRALAGREIRRGGEALVHRGSNPGCRKRFKSSAPFPIDLLPGSPIITIAEAQRLTGGCKSSVIEAMKRLESADVITSITAGRQREQSYQAKDIVDAFLDLERQFASPAGDTLIETPVRDVSARRQL